MSELVRLYECPSKLIVTLDCGDSVFPVFRKVYEHSPGIWSILVKMPDGTIRKLQPRDYEQDI